MTNYLAQRIIRHDVSTDPLLRITARIGPGLVIFEADIEGEGGTVIPAAVSKHYIVTLTWAGTVDEAALAALRERFVREEVLPARWNHFPELEGRDDG